MPNNYIIVGQRCRASIDTIFEVKVKDIELNLPFQETPT